MASPNNPQVELVRLECGATPPHPPLWTQATDMTRLCPPPCWQCLYEPIATRHDRMQTTRDEWMADVEEVLDVHGADLSDVLAIRYEEGSRTRIKLRVDIPFTAVEAEFRAYAGQRAVALGYDDIDTVLIAGHVDRGQALVVARALVAAEGNWGRRIPDDAQVEQRHASFYRPGGWEPDFDGSVSEWAARWHETPAAGTVPVTTVSVEEA